MGGFTRLPDPAADPAFLLALLHLLLLLSHGHGLAPATGSPLHPAPPASGSWGAALRHTEPGELRQCGHQCVHGEQLCLLPRQHVKVQVALEPRPFFTVLLLLL